MVTPVLFFVTMNKLEQKGETGMGKSRTHGNISGALIGAGCSIVICLAGVAILTQMVLTGKAGEKGVNILVPILLGLAAPLGGQVAHLTSKNSQLVVLVASGIFLVVIVIASLVLDGAYISVLPNIGAVSVGSIISCTLCLKKTSKTIRKKKHYR